MLQVKQQKTLDANQKALKAAEKKAQAQLKQVGATWRKAGGALFGAQPSPHNFPAKQGSRLWQPPPAPPSALPQVRSAAPVITRKPFWFERFHWFISSGAWDGQAP